MVSKVSRDSKDSKDPKDPKNPKDPIQYNVEKAASSKKIVKNAFFHKTTTLPSPTMVRDGKAIGKTLERDGKELVVFIC